MEAARVLVQLVGFMITQEVATTASGNDLVAQRVARLPATTGLLNAQPSMAVTEE
jgi:hypothetical protein